MQKQISIEGIDYPVVLSRRKGMRSVRISIKNGGIVRLSVPYGLPIETALTFLKQKQDWIEERIKPVPKLQHGHRIGKAHTLQIYYGDTTRSHTSIKNQQITVRLPFETDINDAETQQTIKKACIKALTKEAQQLLPQRLEDLSLKHNHIYNKCDIKTLVSRWGACDQDKNITLSCYLMQLDWNLIDYVLCHELAHTKHPHHQEDFWDEVILMQPDYKELRKELKTKATQVVPTNF